MDTSLKPSTVSESIIIWALLASFLAHALFAVVIPAFKFDSIKKEVPIELKIELVKPKEPEPVLIPEPPKPIEPEPKPEVVKPEPKKISPKPLEPKPVPQNNEPQAEPTVEQPVQKTEPPNVIAVKPAPDTTPVQVVPPQPPEPPKKAEPTDGDYDAYKNSVQRELQRNIRYPKMAEKRGIQGEAKVEIKLDDQGNVTSVTIAESSGSEVLDNAAIETVKRSNLKQYMKEILLGKLKSFKVPVAFVLAES